MTKTHARRRKNLQSKKGFKNFEKKGKLFSFFIFNSRQSSSISYTFSFYIVIQFLVRFLMFRCMRGTGRRLKVCRAAACVRRSLQSISLLTNIKRVISPARGRCIHSRFHQSRDSRICRSGTFNFVF